MKIGIIVDPHLQERNPSCRKDNYLETVLAKLSYIANGNDYVIILGDLLNLPSNSTYLFNRLYMFFKQYPNKFMSILGNHEIFCRSHTDLEKTTIGSLYYTGAIDIKTSTFEIDNTKFAVSLVDKSNFNEIPIDENNENILLGHNYYEMNTCLEESLTKEDLKKLNYNLVFLGHDHSPHEERYIGNSTLLRSGSITRIDTQTYNQTRGIFYYQFDTETREYELREVPHLPVEEVYLENSFNKQPIKKRIDYINIGKVFEKFENNISGSISVDEVLVEVGAKQICRKHIKLLYEQNGLIYS
jgi:predicted phosphodiesterase